MNRRLLIALSLIALAGCAAMLPPLTPAQTSWATRQWPGTTEHDMISARALYVTRCSSCHNVVLPGEHTLTDWDDWLVKMAPKAKLAPGEKETIRKYLAAAIAAP